MIYVIVGPTGVGKTKLSLEYALKHDAVIVNGDAFQCYKEMNIGTAKPTLEERKLVPHYLFDITSVSNTYTIYDYQKDLRNTLNELLKLNKDILIVGGSGLYLKSSLYDFTLIEANTEVDMSKYEKMDNEELYNELIKIDPESSKNIHQNNRKRVLRAIQIFLESGDTKSHNIAKQEHKLLYDVIFIGLSKESREELYDCINKRVDKMIEDGLINEVNSLKEKFSPSLRAFQAIGYKELMVDYDLKDLNDIISLIKQRTRNYAKRQYTYFNHQLPVNWFNDYKDALIFMEENNETKKHL